MKEALLRRPDAKELFEEKVSRASCCHACFGLSPTEFDGDEDAASATEDGAGRRLDPVDGSLEWLGDLTGSEQLVMELARSLHSMDLDACVCQILRLEPDADLPTQMEYGALGKRVAAIRKKLQEESGPAGGPTPPAALGASSGAASAAGSSGAAAAAAPAPSGDAGDGDGDEDHSQRRPTGLVALHVESVSRFIHKPQFPLQVLCFAPSALRP